MSDLVTSFLIRDKNRITNMLGVSKQLVGVHLCPKHHNYPLWSSWRGQKMSHRWHKKSYERPWNRHWERPEWSPTQDTQDGNLIQDAWPGKQGPLWEAHYGQCGGKAEGHLSLLQGQRHCSHNDHRSLMDSLRHGTWTLPRSLGDVQGDKARMINWQQNTLNLLSGVRKAISSLDSSMPIRHIIGGELVTIVHDGKRECIVVNRPIIKTRANSRSKTGQKLYRKSWKERTEPWNHAI